MASTIVIENRLGHGIHNISLITDVLHSWLIGCGNPLNVTDATRIGPNSFTVGGTATYTCKTGYRLVGNAIIQCLSTGQWTPIPHCRYGKLKFKKIHKKFMVVCILNRI